MTVVSLPEEDIERIKAHVAKHRMTLAVIRTDMAPPELMSVFDALASACSLAFRNALSSPLSEFGIAELNSKDKMLIVLHVGGPMTELLSVSETDELAIRELEENIHSSNFHSEIIRMGL